MPQHKPLTGAQPPKRLFCCLLFVLIQLLISFDTCYAAPGNEFYTASVRADQVKNMSVQKTTAAVCITSGLLTGTAHIFFSITEQTDNSTSLYTDILSAVPSLLIGSYTGYKTSQWLSEKMLNNSNDPFLLFFIKGICYSSVSGAVIFTSSVLPLFITSYYTASIDFNFDSSSDLSGVLISSFSGGAGYGMLFGALFGTIYSSFIYMIIN